MRHCGEALSRVIMCCMGETQSIEELLRWDIADRLRKALRFSGVSVGEMAEDLGVSRNTVGRYVNGHVLPDYRTMRLWAMRCGVPLDWLQTGDMDDSGKVTRDTHKYRGSAASMAEPVNPPSVRELVSYARRRLSHTAVVQVTEREQS